MSENSNASEKSGRSPPYVPFPSFKTMLMGFKEQGLPSRIDRSVLTKFSGVIGSQLLSALRFLSLIDEDNHPKPGLQTLVAAAGSEHWASALEVVLKKAFAPIFTLDLKTATSAQFNERFRAEYPGEGSTLRKTMTFFLGALKDAQVPVSSYIMANKKPRNATMKKRSPRGDGGSPPGKVRQSVTPQHPPAPAAVPKSPFLVLMEDIYDPASMDGDEQQAVFTLARFLKTRKPAG